MASSTELSHICTSLKPDLSVIYSESLAEMLPPPSLEQHSQGPPQPGSLVSDLHQASGGGFDVSLPKPPLTWGEGGVVGGSGHRIERGVAGHLSPIAQRDRVESGKKQR